MYNDATNLTNKYMDIYKTVLVILPFYDALSLPSFIIEVLQLSIAQNYAAMCK